MSIGPPIPEKQHFQNLTLKIKGQGKMTMMLHNYRSRQCHRTSNGTDPSRGFRDMGFAKSGPNAAWFDKFLVHGQAHMGQMGKWPWQCTTTGLDNSTELRTEKIHQTVTEIWAPQVWQPPAQPPARTVTTIPLQPGGLRGKKDPCIQCVKLIIPKMFQIVPCVIAKISWQFHENPLINFTVVLLTNTFGAPRWETMKQSRQVWNSLANYFLCHTWHFINMCHAWRFHKNFMKIHSPVFL